MKVNNEKHLEFKQEITEYHKETKKKKNREVTVK